MNFKISDARLREVYKASPHSIQKRIEEWYPSFEPEFHYMKGQWYVDDDNPTTMIRFTETLDKEGDPIGYGFVRGKWFNQDGIGVYFKSPRVATEKEVYQALVREARLRGFFEGTVCKNHHGTWTYDGSEFKPSIATRMESCDGIYSSQDGWGRWIVINGEWAEIPDGGFKTVTRQQIADIFEVPVEKIKIIH